MSYSCFISFKKMNSTEMLTFFKQLKEHMTEHLADVAKENHGYCPYIRRKELADVSGHMTREEWDALPAEEKKDLFPRDLRNVDLDARGEAKDWAMSHVFKYAVFYDESRGLLGMFSIPDVARELFDGTVYFQNSCDQNYPRSDWEGIAAFEEIYDRWQQMTPEQLHAHWVATNNPNLQPGEKPRTLYDEYEYELRDMTDDEAEQFWADRFAYMRQSYAYDEIWSHYHDELYNDANRLYLSLYSRDDFQAMNIFLKECHEAHVAHCDKYQCQDFETLCGQHPEKFEMWQRFYKGKPFDYLSEMDNILRRSPGFLERNPQYQEMYDKFMAEHKDDAPVGTDDIEQDDVSK